MIGSQNLTGPDADLGARFLNGQAVNLKLPDLTKIQQNAPAGAVWCTYQDNKQVCGRSPTSPARPATSSPPPKPSTASAIQDAGDAIYPYIQGRAGNRTAAGFSALAASAAAAPFPAAAYTAVLTARLLLRLGLIAGLFVGIGMMVRPHLARRVLNVIAGSLLVVLLFSAAGALMTYLSMVMLSPTTVAGFQIDPNSGVIILALASLVAWLLTRPIKRITGMLSYAATGNPHQLSDQRRRAMAGLQPAHSTAPLAPRTQSPGQRPAGEPDRSGHADRTGPAEPPRTGHHRPTPQQHAPAGSRRQPARRLPAPDAGCPAEPPTTPIPRIKPAIAAGSTPAAGRPSAAEPTRVIPVVAAANRHRTRPRPGPRNATEQRPAAGQLHRQVWNGTRLGARRRRPRLPPRPRRPAGDRAGRRHRRCSGHRTRRPGPTTADPKPAPPAGPTPSTTRGGPDERTRRLALATPQSRGRLIALVLAGLALALITKTILDTGASTAAPAAGPTGAPAIQTTTTATTKPTAVPTNPDECVAQWAKGPDRDACLYREYGYTPSAEPTRNRASAIDDPAGRRRHPRHHDHRGWRRPGTCRKPTRPPPWT